MGHKLALAIILFFANSAIGQTRSDFERQYGTPVPAYQVSETIWMTPAYTADGQVCQMRLYPQRFSSSANYISPTLPFQELMTVLNQLVPLARRGTKKEPFEAGATGGRVEWMSYSYENMKVTFVAAFDPAPDSWKNRNPYVFSVEPSAALITPKKTDTRPTENDFSASQGLNAEIVTIQWIGRQCSKQ